MTGQSPDGFAGRPERRRYNRRRWTIIGALVFLAAFAATGAVLYYQTLCPGACVDITVVQRANLNQASIVYDRQGREIAQFSVESRRSTALDSLPPVVAQAFLAVEDHRFYQHHGVDWRRIAGAVLRNVVKQRAAEGFSTITMQLARNTYPDILPAREKSLRRKLKEIQVARAIERNLSKHEILERYLNTISFGQGAFGIDVAARTYFGKPSAALTLSEAALLAALPKSPTHYNPFRNPTAALTRRNLILGMMQADGDVTANAARNAIAAPLGVHRGDIDSTTHATARIAPYFVEDVRKLLAPLGAALYRRGYRIYTTLDIDAQAAAERAVETQMVKIETGSVGRYLGPSRAAVLAAAQDTTTPGRAVAQALRRGLTPYLQGAAVLIDADSGDVLALVGGRSFAESHYDRVTQARRQPGSAFKPFVYATALIKGYVGEDLVSDEPLTVPLPDGGTWTPDNFERDPQDTITLSQALAMSRNRATVRVALDVGFPAIIETAHNMGLGTDFPSPPEAYPSIALGAREVQMLDLVGAYSPVARLDGQTVRPRFIRAVIDPASQQSIFEEVPTLRSALTPPVAASLRAMLQGVVDHGTGNPVRQAGFTGPVAGKTGTTNAATDVWFVGATPDYVAGVWLGFDVPHEIMPGRDGTGGRLAGPIWADFMHAIGAATPRNSWRARSTSGGARARTDVGPTDSLPVDTSRTDATPRAVRRRPVPTDDTTRLCVAPQRTAPDGSPVSSLVPCRGARPPADTLTTSTPDRWILPR
jgi:1A family penicillin-binding protein